MTASATLEDTARPRTRQRGAHAVDADRPRSRSDVEAMLRAGRAAVGADDVEVALRVILEGACGVAGTESASIMAALVPGRDPRLVASTELSPSFRDVLAGGGPEVLAIPLLLGGRSFGTLNVYRGTAGPWAPDIVEMLGYFAQHAATALYRATLVASQRRQLDALERVVGVLRGQAEEYAGRLASLSDLLATEGVEDARQHVFALMAMHHANPGSVIDRLHDPIVAGLVLALVEHARRRHVDVRLHRASHLEGLPARLIDAEAVSIIANLVVNAVEAVAGLPRARRRVSLRIRQGRESVHIAVRDWGHGVRAPDRDAIFTKGTSSKDDHRGVGLALVSDAVRAVDGRVSLRSHGQGTTFDVVLPC